MKPSIMIFLLGLGSFLSAQDTFTEKCLEAKSMLHHGYDTWNEPELQESLGLFQRILNLNQETWLVHYYIGLGHYRLSTVYMDRKDKEKAEQHLDEAIDHLEICKKLNETFPESYALIASCLGNKIGLAPWKGMILGPKSSAEMIRALQYGPQNPRVWLMKGINSKYSPKLFGGGKEKALEELKQAVVFFEADSVANPLYPSWGYDLAYAWIGIIHTETGDFNSAQKAFEKGLEIYPQNGWIRHQLIPQLEKKQNEK